MDKREIHCPVCTIRFKIAHDSHGEVTCPKCRARFDPDAPPEPPDGPPPEPADAFLDRCPICKEGAIILKSAEDDDSIWGDETRLLCTTCESVLEESIYGYVYVHIDERYAREMGKYKGEVLSKEELADLAGIESASGQSSAQSEDALRDEEDEEEESTIFDARMAEPSIKAEEEPQEEESSSEELVWSVDEESMDETEPEASKEEDAASEITFPPEVPTPPPSPVEKAAEPPTPAPEPPSQEQEQEEESEELVWDIDEETEEEEEALAKSAPPEPAPPSPPKPAQAAPRPKRPRVQKRRPAAPRPKKKTAKPRIDRQVLEARKKQRQQIEDLAARTLRERLLGSMKVFLLVVAVVVMLRAGGSYYGTIKQQHHLSNAKEIKTFLGLHPTGTAPAGLLAKSRLWVKQHGEIVDHTLLLFALLTLAVRITFVGPLLDDFYLASSTWRRRTFVSLLANAHAATFLLAALFCLCMRLNAPSLAAMSIPVAALLIALGVWQLLWWALAGSSVRSRLKAARAWGLCDVVFGAALGALLIVNPKMGVRHLQDVLNPARLCAFAVLGNFTVNSFFAARIYFPANWPRRRAVVASVAALALIAAVGCAVWSA